MFNLSVLQRLSQDIPIESLWRLFVDFNRQENGPLSFEKFENPEIGYLTGMYYGLDYLLQTLDQPLSPELLIELHDQCIHGVAREIKYITEDEKQYTQLERFTPGIRKHGTDFRLMISGPVKNLTKAGLIELFDLLVRGNKRFAIELTENNAHVFTINSENVEQYNNSQTIERIMNIGENDFLSISLPALRTSVLAEEISNIINHYTREIQITDSPESKIKAIAQCIHQLELLHPFEDANCRTIVTLLLNKLLLQNGFGWAILTNPNRFDAYSINELCSEITEGINRSQQFVAEPFETLDPYIDLRVSLVRFLLAYDALKTCAHWDKLTLESQNHTLSTIEKELSKLHLGIISSKQCTLIKEQITLHVNKAMIKTKPSFPFFRHKTDEHYLVKQKSLKHPLSKDSLNLKELSNDIKNILVKPH